MTEKRNTVESSITRCDLCGEPALTVDGEGKALCSAHFKQKRAESEHERLKNAADHLTSAE